MKKYIIGIIIVIGFLEISGQATSVQSYTPSYDRGHIQIEPQTKNTPLENNNKNAKQTYQYTEIKQMEDELINLVNEYRTENGLRSVKKTDFLQKSALFKSTTMLEYDYFGHDNPYLGENKGSVYLADNYLKLPSYHGENIYYTANTKISVQQIFDKFKNSPSHNELMLHNKVGIIGIGIIKSESSGDFFNGSPVYLVTMHFGY